MKALVMAGVLCLGGQAAAQMNSPRSAPVKPTPQTTDIQVAQGGRALLVRPGDTLRFILPNNVSTGYTWRALEVDPAYLTFLGKSTQQAPTTTAASAVGAPGPDLVYTYQVRQALTQGGAALALPVGFVQLPPGRTPLDQFSGVVFYLSPR